MDLVTKIRNDMMGLTRGKSVDLKEVLDGNEGWILHVDDKMGVAIPCGDQELLLEKFAKIHLEYVPTMIIGGHAHSVLFLYMYRQEVDVKILREFASVCESFVFPGITGELRSSILANPLKWWRNWKSIMGNVNAEKQEYSILGELIVYKYLLDAGITPEWTGSDMARLDFVADGINCEVKSTQSRYSNEIVVHGQFQLLLEAGTLLNLYFCRLEENPAGESIDDLVQQLIARQVDAEYLNDELARLGFREGNSSRKEKYKLIEMRRYTVDENFPKITPAQFVDGKIPDGVLRMEYTVDLSNLDNEVLQYK